MQELNAKAMAALLGNYSQHESAMQHWKELAQSAAELTSEIAAAYDRSPEWNDSVVTIR